MAAPFTLALGDYDHTRDLASGAVEVEDFDVEVTTFGAPEPMFAAFTERREFDASEMSLAVYSSLRSRGDDEFTAIPVFPARSFRHSAIYVRSGGVTAPEQLAGARIGIPVWTQTAGVYVRGLLSDHYGVDLHGIDWHQAGIDEPGRAEPVTLDAGGFEITPRPDTTLDRMLLDGEVDAVISARPPRCVVDRNPAVGRLFEDFPAAEREYYAQTGIFPIMHVVVVRRELIDDNPGLARALFTALESAKNRSIRRAQERTVPSFPLPWVAEHAAETAAALGPDFWPYGVEANRPTLEAFLGFAAEQEILASPVSPEQLFPSEFHSESLVHP